MRSKPARKGRTYRSLSELPVEFVPLDEAKRTRAQDALSIEKRFGPDVARITRRGRPPKGSKTEPGRIHSLRIADSTWRLLEKQASAVGLSTNAAVQIAVSSWTKLAPTLERIPGSSELHRLRMSKRPDRPVDKSAVRTTEAYNRAKSSKPKRAEKQKSR